MLFSPLISNPLSSARFRVLTVGDGWHWRPVWDLMIHLSLALLPIEFRLVAEPGLDSYTLLRRINY